MEKIELARVFSSKAEYLAFLRQRYDKVYQDFNDATKTENKSIKWRLLRLEKVIRLITENPDYELGFCFKCGKKIDEERLKSEPESIWCVPCATEHENKFRHRGGHWAFAQKPKGGGCLG